MYSSYCKPAGYREKPPNYISLEKWNLCAAFDGIPKNNHPIWAGSQGSRFHDIRIFAWTDLRPVAAMVNRRLPPRLRRRNAASFEGRIVAFVSLQLRPRYEDLLTRKIRPIRQINQIGSQTGRFFGMPWNATCTFHPSKVSWFGDFWRFPPTF